MQTNSTTILSLSISSSGQNEIVMKFSFQPSIVGEKIGSQFSYEQLYSCQHTTDLIYFFPMIFCTAMHKIFQEKSFNEINMDLFSDFAGFFFLCAFKENLVSLQLPVGINCGNRVIFCVFKLSESEEKACRSPILSSFLFSLISAIIFTIFPFLSFLPLFYFFPFHFF